MTPLVPARVVELPEPSPDFSDPRWVERIRAGDAEAFERVFRAFHPTLTAWIARRLGSRAVAEDIVQDLFLTLWRGRESLEVHRSLPHYLYVAARNRAMNHVKHERVREQWREKQSRNEPPTSDDGDAELALAELTAALREAIERLPPRSKAVFLMSRQQGKTYAEIAAALGIARKTVDAQMGRALRLIRSHVKDLLP